MALNIKSIFIGRFKSQIKNCETLIEGNIIIDYISRKITSTAKYTENCRCPIPEEKSIEDIRDLDEETEITMDALSGAKGNDWDKIVVMKIVLTETDIHFVVYGEKNGKKGHEKYTI